MMVSQKRRREKVQKYCTAAVAIPVIAGLKEKSQQRRKERMMHLLNREGPVPGRVNLWIHGESDERN